MNQPSPITHALAWQSEKRLQSQDLLWILTNTFTEWRSFRGDATPQKFFRVGCFDLRTRRVGYVRFSLDDCNGILMAGLPAAPWPTGLSQAILVKRLAHDGGEEKGRFKVDITPVDIDPVDAWVAPVARAMFAKDGFWSNATHDMWRRQADRVALAKAIEATALGMVGRFSAGDLKKALGVNANVTPILRRLVQEKRLLPYGKKRGALYEVAPPMVPERIDWAG